MITATLDRDGYLILKPSTETEYYALLRWVDGVALQAQCDPRPGGGPWSGFHVRDPDTVDDADSD